MIWKKKNGMLRMYLNELNIHNDNRIEWSSVQCICNVDVYVFVCQLDLANVDLQKKNLCVYYMVVCVCPNDLHTMKSTIHTSNIEHTTLSRPVKEKYMWNIRFTESFSICVSRIHLSSIKFDCFCCCCFILQKRFYPWLFLLIFFFNYFFIKLKAIVIYLTILYICDRSSWIYLQ